IELRIVMGTNRHFSPVAFQGAAKHPTEAARMIGIAYHNDGVKLLLIAPLSKHGAFILCASYIPGDLLDIQKPQGFQFANVLIGPIFEWDASTSELSFRSIPSIGENCDSGGHPAVNKIRSFKQSGSAGFAGNNDHVGGRWALIDNERPSGCPQNRMSYRRHRSAANGQEHEYQ